MTKQELIKETAQRTGRTNAETERMIDLIISVIVEAVHTGGEVKIKNFGTFTKKKRRARMARNPQNGELVHVEAAWSPKFRASDAFKKLVNDAS